MSALRYQLCALLVILLSIAATWVIRGMWDEAFFMNNTVHVINHSSKSIHLQLQFPSGVSYDCKMQGGGSECFRVGATGEGSVKVVVNQKVVDRVGYVSSMNSIMVFSVDETSATFSQIFPSMDLDEIIPSR
jgi:hypothetical protein